MAPADGRETRFERDVLGSVEVPAEALYGAHTVRALVNFALGGQRLADVPALVSAIAEVKIAAARANVAIGVLEPALGQALVSAGREVRGLHVDEFPLPVLHGGGGTSFNMNTNEVLANRANQLLGTALGTYHPVHPNDHANRSQSTNDVVPTAISIAFVREGQLAVAGLRHFRDTVLAKADEQGELERLGRTCLQDAVPLSVGDTHRAQAHAVERAAGQLESELEALLAVPLGATVLGTGVGAPPRYVETVLPLLAEETGLAITGASDLFAALAHAEAYLAVAHALERAASVLAKIAADLRFLASGPVGGIGEVTLPALQAGSSAMPGKVNPVLPELVLQVSYGVRGTAATVAAAVAGGELELNVMEMVIARALLGSFAEVAGAARLFADRCFQGLRWNEDRVARHLEGSLAGRVVESTERGYDAASGTARR
ncbi:MAG: lyase family protein [Gaiella sp.]